MKRDQHLRSRAHRFRHAYLLIALVLVVFVRPFLDSTVITPAVIDLLVFVSLIAGAWAALDRRITFAIVLALGLTSAVVQGVFVAQGGGAAGAGNPETSGGVLAGGYIVSTLLFYSVVAFAMIRALFGTQRGVTSDTLFQAVSAFLLLGLAWTYAYVLLELAAPGSFAFGVADTGRDIRFTRFVGFSFTTLTTLGYGNIAPATPKADALANAQAITGQVYVAIVIARLVALQLAESMVRNQHNDTQ